MKNSTQRAIRWGELLAPLEAKAHEEGATVPALVRRVVRAYLGANTGSPPQMVPGRDVRGTLHAFGWLTIRPGRLGAALEKRAQEEKTCTSEIARRAIRLYLANEELPDIRQFAQELRALQKDLASYFKRLEKQLDAKSY